jgi:hypothetical protein
MPVIVPIARRPHHREDVHRRGLARPIQPPSLKVELLQYPFTLTIGFLDSCRILRSDNAQPQEEHMCRNIKPLYNFEPAVNDEEVRAASLQYVRKISGFNKPSKAN